MVQAICDKHEKYGTHVSLYYFVPCERRATKYATVLVGVVKYIYVARKQNPVYEKKFSNIKPWATVHPITSISPFPIAAATFCAPLLPHVLNAVISATRSASAPAGYRQYQRPYLDVER